MDRPLLRPQALTILKIINCPFKFLQDFEVGKRLMPNPFEFAASLMNVDSKLLSTFKILHFTFKIFLTLAIGWWFFSLFPIGWLGRLLCAFMMAAAESAVYYPHHEGGRGLLCVFMIWWANLPFAIHIMNVLSSLLSAFMKKVVQLYGHHECGMLNFECA